MIIENINVYDLVLSQIMETIEKLKQALKIVKNRKQTISKVALFESQEYKCPHCGSFKVVKNGHTKAKVQTYKCKECGKRFNDLTNTVFSGCNLTYEQIEIFWQCFIDKVSIRKTAKRMNVNKNTVHLLRLKVIDSLKEIRKNIILSGTIEADEIYRSINLKGTKPENMPRFSKPRTSNGNSTKGISSHKVCIASAIDELDTTFLEIVGTGPLTSEMAKETLESKCKNVTKLITDCKSSYEGVVKDNNWNLKQVKSKGYVDAEGNSLANINSVHSGLTTFLAHFRGVSTKHLQGYLDWYTFDKYLNYTFEDEKQANELMRIAVTSPTDITTLNMYDNHSGIDFFAVYSDYHFIPSRTN